MEPAPLSASAADGRLATLCPVPAHIFGSHKQAASAVQVLHTLCLTAPGQMGDLRWHVVSLRSSIKKKVRVL